MVDGACPYLFEFIFMSREAGGKIRRVRDVCQLNSDKMFLGRISFFALTAVKSLYSAVFSVFF
jgi:hypothetical protein